MKICFWIFLKPFASKEFRWERHNIYVWEEISKNTPDYNQVLLLLQDTVFSPLRKLSQNQLLQLCTACTGLIKSYSPTSRTSDFWGRTSKNLPFSSPRTTGFFQSTCPKLLSLRCHKVLFPVNSYYLLPVNPDVWSPSWLFCGGKAWHLFLKDFTHFCATSFYPFVLLLILLLKGFKNFLMLVPSTNDKND